QIFFGNDIFPCSVFNRPWNTNVTSAPDVVNNVENVFLAPALASQYSVTVLGRRVNVNAVRAQTNDVAQDYALVISSADGGIADALTLTDGPVLSAGSGHVTMLTNSFDPASGLFGEMLLHQRVG